MVDFLHGFVEAKDACLFESDLVLNQRIAVNAFSIVLVVVEPGGNSPGFFDHCCPETVNFIGEDVLIEADVQVAYARHKTVLSRGRECDFLSA